MNEIIPVASEPIMNSTMNTNRRIYIYPVEFRINNKFSIRLA